MSKNKENEKLYGAEVHEDTAVNEPVNETPAQEPVQEPEEKKEDQVVPEPEQKQEEAKSEPETEVQESVSATEEEVSPALAEETPAGEEPKEEESEEESEEEVKLLDKNEIDNIVFKVTSEEMRRLDTLNSEFIEKVNLGAPLGQQEFKNSVKPEELWGYEDKETKE